MTDTKYQARMAKKAFIDEKKRQDVKAQPGIEY